jgi:CRP-like cAMP-binding protein
MHEMQEDYQLLLSHWLLANVPTEELDLLLPEATEVRFLPGDVLFREGDPADGLYLITAGSVRVSAPEEGKGTVYAIVGADDVVGEMGVLDGQPRSATATALSLCTTYFLPAEPLLDALESSPGLSVRLLALLTIRLRLVDRRLAEMPGAEAPSRWSDRADDELTSRDPADIRLPRSPTSSAQPRTPMPSGESRFYRWLMERTSRADAVGDVARHARDSADWPRGTEDVDTLVLHLDAVYADDALRVALRRAWKMWSLNERRGRPSGGVADV